MGAKFNQKRKMEIVLSADSLEFVAIDMLGPFPRTKTGSQSVSVMTKKSTKLTRAISTSKVVPTQDAGTFFTD